jgi:hypothetical protein
MWPASSIKPLLGGEEAVGEGADAVEVGEVEFADLHVVDAGERFLGGGAAAGGDDDVGAGAGEGAGGLEADAGVAAGDDRELAGQVDAGQRAWYSSSVTRSPHSDSGPSPGASHMAV